MASASAAGEQHTVDWQAYNARWQDIWQGGLQKGQVRTAAPVTHTVHAPGPSQTDSSVRAVRFRQHLTMQQKYTVNNPACAALLCSLSFQ